MPEAGSTTEVFVSKGFSGRDGAGATVRDNSRRIRKILSRFRTAGNSLFYALEMLRIRDSRRPLAQMPARRTRLVQRRRRQKELHLPCRCHQYSNNSIIKLAVSCNAAVNPQGKLVPCCRIDVPPLPSVAGSYR